MKLDRSAEIAYPWKMTKTLKTGVMLLSFAVFCNSVSGGGLSGKRRPFIDMLENCPIQKTYLSTIKNVKIRYPENSLLIDYDIVTSKKSLSQLRFTWEIIRCASKENPDTCLTINTIRLPDFCRMVNAEGECWSPMLDCMTPRLACPIEKGLNAGKNCSVNVAAFRLFPLGNAYWKFRCTVYEGKKKIRMCIDIACYSKEH